MVISVKMQSGPKGARWQESLASNAIHTTIWSGCIMDHSHTLIWPKTGELANAQFFPVIIFFAKTIFTICAYDTLCKLLGLQKHRVSAKYHI